MQVNVRYLDNLRLEASFDDFSIIADQPIRYKGDGSAPGPFDYFLASSALCAAYFVKVYCNARDIPTDDIQIIQNNIVSAQNRYKQSFNLEITLPESISEKDKAGIIKSMERCSVKRVIQNTPDFVITSKSISANSSGLLYDISDLMNKKTYITGKDTSLEESIIKMSGLLEILGIQIEIASWRNLIPHVWSVHIRDAESPMCYTNGKGNTKEAALASALGEFLERLSCNYFYADYYLGEEISTSEFVHYPQEEWFNIPGDNYLPHEILDPSLILFYNSEEELTASHLIDTNSGNKGRGICSLPFVRQSDNKTIYFPVNIIGNLYVSNGMSAGNSKNEARVQALSEIFERAIKNKVIKEEITLPTVPKEIIAQFSEISEGIQTLEDKGYQVVVKDSSLGGIYPVLCVAILIPETGGAFVSFGSHPNFEIALQRSLTELLQGRSFEGLKELPSPTFNSFAVSEHNNIIDHFIDSTGVVSWKFFSDRSSYDFCPWNLEGSTSEECEYLLSIMTKIKKDVYIADYNDLGFDACRIIVPDFSELYEPQDLVWDNNNQSLLFRDDILNLHSLNNKKLKELLDKLQNSELDDYLLISELIGYAFDENSVWGQLNIGELKCHIQLALGLLEDAKEYVEMFQSFNDYGVDRKRFYQLLNNLLSIELTDEFSLSDYEQTFRNLYGEDLFNIGTAVISAQTLFFGFEKLESNFINSPKHHSLIESYKKIHSYRSDNINRI